METNYKQLKISVQKLKDRIAILEDGKEMTSFWTNSIDYVLTWIGFNLKNVDVEIM